MRTAFVGDENGDDHQPVSVKHGSEDENVPEKTN
jgi:hypothetical protein